jgi:hypothetical protein
MARHRSAEFRAYPLLTPEEFAEVCHYLDRRYCRASLGPVRRRWKLSVCRALDTNAAFTLGPEYSTFVQIVRPLDGELDDGGLSACLDGFSLGDDNSRMADDIEADREMMEAEEADQVVPTLAVYLTTRQRSHQRCRRPSASSLIPSPPVTATSGTKSICTRPTRHPACGSVCTIFPWTSGPWMSTLSSDASCHHNSRRPCEPALVALVASQLT